MALPRHIALLAILTLAGCSAIKTTMLTRHASEEVSKDPCNPICGIPVMLRVPSHLEVEVVETTYFSVAGQSIKPVSAPDGKPGLLPGPDRDVKARLAFTEKMFVVDPLRVFSGTGGYGFGFASDPPTADQLGHGYLSSLSYKADDTTIKDTASLLANVLPLLGRKTAAGEEPATDKVILSQRTVAYRRFNLASPTFEQDVQDFVQAHINTPIVTLAPCPALPADAPIPHPAGTHEPPPAPAKDSPPPPPKPVSSAPRL